MWTTVNSVNGGAQETRIYKPLRANVRNTRLYADIVRKIGGEEKLYSAFEELDKYWQTNQFVAPNAVKIIEQLFGDVFLTVTEILYIILAWQESRTTRDMHNQVAAGFRTHRPKTVKV